MTTFLNKYLFVLPFNGHFLVAQVPEEGEQLPSTGLAPSLSPQR